MTKTGMTQKQRSAATRRKLLDAATAVLILDGYVGLTTTRVCKTAGMSQGALFKHFPSKTALVAGLAEDLYAGLAKTFQASFETGMDETCDVIHQAIRRLWDVFSSPRQIASYDLTLAARTDKTLAGILAPIVLAHRRRIRVIAGQVSCRLPQLDTKQFLKLSDMVLMAIQGAVINNLACPEPEIMEQRLEFMETFIKQSADPKEAL